MLMQFAMSNLKYFFPLVCLSLVFFFFFWFFGFEACAFGMYAVFEEGCARVLILFKF